VSINVTNLAVGFVLSLLIAAVAVRARSLSESGAIGAVVEGTVIFGLGGWMWGILLIAFFVSSSALSHYRAARKASLAEKFAKTGRRDLSQVLANGGWGALLAALSVVVPDRWPLFVAFAGGMAAVNADTWATELGVLSSHQPRLIINGHVVSVGTSGAISSWGMAAAIGGSLFIAGIAMVLSALHAASAVTDLLWLGVATVCGGLAGSLVDSLLGATVQGIYWCERDQKETEKRVHSCGQPTRLLRGWAWMDNEWVNFLCSLAGSLVAWLLWLSAVLR